MTKQKIKDCPFCGEEAKLKELSYDSCVSKADYKVECSDIYCGDIGTKDEAIKYWNNRPIEDALQAKLDKEKQSMKLIKKMLPLNTKLSSKDVNILVDAIYSLVLHGSINECKKLNAELDKWRARAGAWKTADGVWVSGYDIVYDKTEPEVNRIACFVVREVTREYYSTREAAEKAAGEEK